MKMNWDGIQTGQSRPKRNKRKIRNVKWELCTCTQRETWNQIEEFVNEWASTISPNHVKQLKHSIKRTVNRKFDKNKVNAQATSIVARWTTNEPRISYEMQTHNEWDASNNKKKAKLNYWKWMKGIFFLFLFSNLMESRVCASARYKMYNRVGRKIKIVMPQSN